GFRSGGFGTGRWLRPAKLLDRTRDHLLSLRRPAKFWGPCHDYLLSCLAVRLPSQDARNTNTNRDQKADKPPRASLFHVAFRFHTMSHFFWFFQIDTHLLVYFFIRINSAT